MSDPAVRLDDLLMRAARALRRGWAQALEPLSLTPHQARALRVIGELGAPRLGTVAERLHIAPRSATEVVDALAERELVERVADEGDRRAICVRLTGSGAAVLAEVETAQTAVAARHFAQLDDRDRADLTRVLLKLDSGAGRAALRAGAER